MNRQNAAEAIEVYKQVEHLRARLALLRRADWRRIDLRFALEGWLRTPGGYADTKFEITSIAASDVMNQRARHRPLALHIIQFQIDLLEAEIPPLQRRLAQLGFKPEDAK